MINKTKLVNIISMACKAGKVISGEFVIEKTLSSKNHRIKIILLAQDVSDATKEKYGKMQYNHGLNLRQVELTKDELAACIGKTDRAAIAVVDQGFAKAIEKILETK